MNNNIKINVDDAGISIGVNSAIESMIKENKISSFSILTNQNYTENAIEIANKNKHIKIGLHFNLTIGKSLSKLYFLTDKNNNFKYGFFTLFILNLFKYQTIKKESEIELRKQLDYLISNNITINHIDSHRHIHCIPAIFEATLKCAKEYNIKNIRIINECIVNTITDVKNISFLFNDNLIKYIILRLLSSLNCKIHNFKTNTYFFSILHSCRISTKMINSFKIPKNFNFAEIMIHPGNPAIDKNDHSIKYEKNHLTSDNRILELLK